MQMRLIWATLGVIALLWGGTAAYLEQRRQVDWTEAEKDAGNLTHAFEENIRRTVEGIDATIRSARMVRTRDPAHFDLAAWARESGMQGDLTFQMSLANRDGTVVASTLGPLTEVTSIADRAHFRVLKQSGSDDLFISQPVIGRVSGRWSIQFARKLFDRSGGFDGVIVVSLDPDFLARFYRTLDIGRGALILAGADGVLRAAAPDDLARLGTDLSETPLIPGALVHPIGEVEMRLSVGGPTRLFGWRRVDPYGLIVAIGMSVDDVLADYRAMRQACVVGGICLSVLIVVGSTVLVRNRRDLLASRAVLQAAVQNISQGLLVVDAQRQVPVINRRAAELLDLPDTLTRSGISFDDILHYQVEAGEFGDPEQEEVRALVKAGGIRIGDSVYRRTRRNGLVLEFRTKTVDTGLAVRTITDITEQRHVERVLAEARDLAEAAARARSEFLAVMSHEIRTPLNGVLGMTELLEGMELGEVQREHVRVIRRSGRHLLGLLDNLLDFSRLEASGLQLEDTEYDPRALVDGIVDLFRPKSLAKDLKLMGTVANDVPAAVRGDPGRLRQILFNLVGNAIKFTDAGSVTVAVGCAPADGQRMRLVVTVADTGIGIAPEAVDKMFQPFTQMDGSISRRFGGSGLGLAICRSLVELMGGRISVESTPGVGSTFSFDVLIAGANSLAPVEADRRAAEAPMPLASGLSVLLAEDNAVNRMVASGFLKALGHRVSAVENGAEAIAALRCNEYDALVMDVMMPEMDGLTATRLIRTGDGRQLSVAIVGLTASSARQDLDACLGAGMDVAITKPVSRDQLQAALREALAIAANRSGHTAGAEEEGADAIDAGADEAVATESVLAWADNQRLRELTEELGEATVARILAFAVDDARGHVRELRSAVAGQDRALMRRVAHTLKGLAANIGADALAEHAAVLEERGAQFDDAQLLAEIAQLEAALAIAFPVRQAA